MMNSSKEEGKHEIEFTFVDTRQPKENTRPPKNLIISEEKQSVVPTDSPIILLEMIIRKLLESWQYSYWRLQQRIQQWLGGLGLSTAWYRIPWFKIGLITLAIYVLMSKDMQFNIALSAPFEAALTDDRNDGMAQPATYQATTELNPYAPLSAAALKDRPALEFIQQFAPLAISEMNRTKIPASIKMAQALVESRAGTSKLAKNNNNHFGIKCFSRKCKKGHCTNAFDDHHKDFFRNYGSPNESWKAHSQLLGGKRYRHLTTHGKDYKAWANGLKKAGYATDKRYAHKLINTIEKFKLYQLDQ